MNVDQFRRKIHKIFPEICYFHENGEYTKAPELRKLLSDKQDEFITSVTRSIIAIEKESKFNDYVRRDAVRYIETHKEEILFMLL